MTREMTRRFATAPMPRRLLLQGPSPSGSALGGNPEAALGTLCALSRAIGSDNCQGSITHRCETPDETKGKTMSLGRSTLRANIHPLLHEHAAKTRAATSCSRCLSVIWRIWEVTPALRLSDPIFPSPQPERPTRAPLWGSYLQVWGL